MAVSSLYGITRNCSFLSQNAVLIKQTYKNIQNENL